MIDRAGIARALREIATLQRVVGESRFKARAYEHAADVVEHLPGDLAGMVRRRELTTVPGIGDRLAGTIEELARTGRSRLLESLRARFPPGTVELIAIPHVGIKKIAALHRALGITTAAELKAACEAGRVRTVPGFGAKLEKRILAALTDERPPAETLLAAALAAAQTLRTYIETCPSVEAVETAGEVRRCRETVSGLEFLAIAAQSDVVLEHFARYPGAIATVSRTVRAATVRLPRGLMATLHVASPAEHVAARVVHTGSAPHVEKLAARARASGLTLSPTGLWAGSNRLPVADEDELYRRLALQPVPPELREDEGEIEAAARGALPEDLIALPQVHGIVHAHTRYSDGSNTIEEMARAAQAMGMQYLTITDHSPSAVYARGVTLDALARQWEEIARVQERVTVQLLRGTESDILADGSLDYPDALLEQFDIVIASIHARHSLDAEQMTRRILRAVRHPRFKVWGHPLGRLLNKRPPIACDVERILDAMAQAPAAIEINGDPHRLDLEPRWVRAARARGLRFVLSTDAHSVAGLRNVRFAVAMARRGWVRRGEVLNALSAERFRAAVRPVAG